MLEQVGTNGGFHLGAPLEALLGKAQVYLAETREARCRALNVFIAQKPGKLRPAIMGEICLRKQHPVNHLAEAQTPERQVLARMKQQNDAVDHGGGNTGKLCPCTQAASVCPSASWNRAFKPGVPWGMPFGSQ